MNYINITLLILAFFTIVNAQEINPIKGKLINKGICPAPRKSYGVYQEGVPGDDIILHFVYNFNQDADTSLREVNSIRLPITYNKKFTFYKNEWSYHAKDSYRKYYEIVTHDSSRFVLALEKSGDYDGQWINKILRFDFTGNVETYLIKFGGDKVILSPKGEYFFVLPTGNGWTEILIQRYDLYRPQDIKTYKMSRDPSEDINVVFKKDYVEFTSAKNNKTYILKIDHNGVIVK